jgi:predicted transcriptional regulator
MPSIRRSSASSAFSSEVPTPEPLAAAQATLREFEESYGASDAPPVPVERIARSLLDLYVDEHDDIRSLPNAPDDHGHLSGMLDPNEMVIWIDRAEASRSPGRRRFTIAHEIGHFRMHLPVEGVFLDRPQDVVEVSGAGESTPKESDHRRREREANEFARALLMPEPLVVEHAEASGFNLAALAERFSVSVPAMRLRLRVLGVLPKYMA